MDINSKRRMLEIAGMPTSTLYESADTSAGKFHVYFKVKGDRMGGPDYEHKKSFPTREEAEAYVKKQGKQVNTFHSYVIRTKLVKESGSTVKESITENYNVGNAIEFFLGMFEEMYNESEITDEADATTITETSIEEYLRDMITDELEQALTDPEVKRRILEVVGRAQQGVSSPDQGTLPV